MTSRPTALGRLGTDTWEGPHVTETIESTTAAPEGASAAAGKKRGGGLNSMLLADLKAMAGGMGIGGAGSMKKAQLVEAIKARPGRPAAREQEKRHAEKRKAASRTPPKRRDKAEQASEPASSPRSKRPERAQTEAAGRAASRTRQRSDASSDPSRSGDRGSRAASRPRRAGPQTASDRNRATRAGNREQDREQNREQDRNRDNQGEQTATTRAEQQTATRAATATRASSQGTRPGRRQPRRRRSRSSRNRRRRGRDRDRDRDRRTGTGTRGGGQRNEPDTTILEDDVLVPAAGILDVLDNYAFVRTSGYLPGTDDVYVSLSMVRKFGLRRGDAIVGQVRQPREGERKEKFNPMVRIDSVNGADPEAAKSRVEFAKLTPLYPTERLRLETEPTNLIGRVIDIAAPIGKGQRGLIVSPSKAGKTMIMQSIANSITTNNPECHLMVVLVDERPEEVTDFERSVKGEVISSTFDRPASDHTTVAELAIERAKRLVELGHDVVVLLDGITRLGRAYNLAAPAERPDPVRWRRLGGALPAEALLRRRPQHRERRLAHHPRHRPDRERLEDGRGDLRGVQGHRQHGDPPAPRLRGQAALPGHRRRPVRHPPRGAADVARRSWRSSGSCAGCSPGLDGQQALELLLERLKKSQSNIEFLMQVQKTTPTDRSGRLSTHESRVARRRLGSPHRRDAG